ncbi:hypothetical protein evm_009288 [Chilo suppressalis]|nr:hypothetical protein evm_009288 [Chilo suppressalis]
MTYGAEMWTLTAGLVHQFQIAQRAMERAMLGAPERIEDHSQLSKSVMDQNGEMMKSPDRAPASATSDPRCTEVTALHMEVDTLRWQLAQTEANRQMHIALLKQIVSFLNRVKDHIDNQKIESPRKETTRISPRSFNAADLPRSRSVLHVNKNLEYSIPAKKISAKKISKSISNVNGYKDCIGHRNLMACSLVSDKEISQKISEETLRLITLANTVLSTNLPDLACTCIDNLEDGINKTTETMAIGKEETKVNDTMESLSLIEEDTTKAIIINSISNSEHIYESINNKLIEVKDSTINDFIVSQSPLTCGLENDFATFGLNEKERQTPLSEKHAAEPVNGKILKSTHNKRNEFSHVTNFIEDESGFSSMSSFQEIGIPIISIIPPSPCKEVSYIDEIPDILNEHGNWKTDTLELDKQTVKVFWV